MAKVMEAVLNQVLDAQLTESVRILMKEPMNGVPTVMGIACGR